MAYCTAFCDQHFLSWRNLGTEHLACKKGCAFHAEGGNGYCTCACTETATGPQNYAACGTGCLQANNLFANRDKQAVDAQPATAAPALMQTPGPDEVAAFTGACIDDNEMIYEFFATLTGGIGANCSEAASEGLCFQGGDSRYRGAMRSACPLSCRYCSLRTTVRPTAISDAEEHPVPEARGGAARRANNAGTIVGILVGIIAVAGLALVVARRYARK